MGWTPRGRAMSAYVTGTVSADFLGVHLRCNRHSLALARYLLGARRPQPGRSGCGPRLLPLQEFCARGTFAAGGEPRQTTSAESAAAGQLRHGSYVLFALVGCFTYANFYLAAAPFHLNSAQLGSIFFVYLLGVVITPQSGWFLDRFGFRHATVLYCSMMIVGLLFTLVKSLPVVIVGLAIFSSGVFVAQAAATVQTGAIAGRARSSAAGLYVTFYYLEEAWAPRSPTGSGVGGVAGCVALLGGVSLLSFWLARISSRPSDQLDSREIELVGD